MAIRNGRTVVSVGTVLAARNCWVVGQASVAQSADVNPQ
jgi:hypothetical protein